MTTHKLPVHLKDKCDRYVMDELGIKKIVLRGSSFVIADETN